MTADNAIKLPTDRSMPPVIMTIVMPIAMTAMTTIRSTIAKIFEGLRKSGHLYDLGIIIGALANSGNFSGSVFTSSHSSISPVVAIAPSA